MITLITGTPGAGKTAYAVAQLHALTSSGQGRPVFVMGIPELQVPHEQCPPVAEWTERRPVPEDPSLVESFFTFPEGSLVIIDEAQKIYRPRPTGSKVPDHVSAFERHRHQGLDFWLISQSPSLLDANVRRLVGKHVHIRSLWAGRRLYEWAEASDPESRASRAVAITRRYRLPRRAFRLYKSASLHVKQSRRLPLTAYVFLLVVGGAGYLGWRNYGILDGAWEGTGAYSGGGKAAVTARDESTGRAPGGAAAAPSGPAVQLAVGGAIEDYVPRIATRPETAPLYDGLRQVRSLPVVVGCVEMGEVCRCYTQQGTDAFLSRDQCREWLRVPPFNPWLDPQARPERTAGRESLSYGGAQEEAGAGRETAAPRPALPGILPGLVTRTAGGESVAGARL